LRLIVFGLTGLAVVLFIAQFFGKKGTKNHITRGILVGVLSLVVVVINTLDISIKRGLVWDTAFIIHTVLGSLFFISLGATSVMGYLLKNDKSYLRTHRFLANATAGFLFLTLCGAVLIRLFR